MYAKVACRALFAICFPFAMLALLVNALFGHGYSNVYHITEQFIRRYQIAVFHNSIVFLNLLVSHNSLVCRNSIKAGATSGLPLTMLT